MAWKVDDNGVLQAHEDGSPIWVTETGEEKPVDYQGMVRRLSDVNNASKGHQDRLRELEARYAPLADVPDIPAFLAEANKALEMMRHAPDRDKGIEEQVKLRLEAVSRPLKDQLAAKDKTIADREKALADTQARYHAVKVKTDVLNSRLLSDRIKPEDRPFIQRELMRSGTVGDDGKVLYRTDDGEVIYGEGGEPATADEAVLELLKNLGIDPATKLMSQHGASGSGAEPGSSQHGAFSRTPSSLAACQTREEKIAFLSNPANLRSRA